MGMLLDVACVYHYLFGVRFLLLPLYHMSRVNTIKYSDQPAIMISFSTATTYRCVVVGHRRQPHSLLRLAICRGSEKTSHNS